MNPKVPGIKKDLLALPGLRWLLHNRGFPVIIQLFTLLCAILLIVNGWGIGLEQSPDELLTLRKANLTTLLVWGLWWPAMIAAALILGRAWCTVCPMELVARGSDSLARRLGIRRIPLPGWMRAGWLVLVAYFCLQILVAGFSLHRVPHLTSLMLITIGVSAMGAGLIFSEPRAFCKGLCPAGALLSVYGRFTPLQLDVKDLSVCRQCHTKDCTDPRNRYNFDARSCPSLVRPYARQQADACVLCFQCAKVCPHENIGFGLADASAGSRTHRLLRPYEAAFVAVAAGFVTHEVVGELKWLDAYFHAVPRYLQGLLPALPFGWLEGAWFLVMYPALLWALVALLGRLAGHRGSLRNLLLAAATGAAPIIGMAHLAKALNKLSSWGGYLPFSVQEPQGLQTFQGFMDGSIARPGALLPLSVPGALMLVAMLLMGWRSLRWAAQAVRDSAEHRSLVAARSGFAVTSLLFVTVLLLWVAT